MNERIKQLAEQAEKYADANFKGEHFWTQAYESKFAELVVKDCLDQLLIGDQDEDYDKGIYWSREQIKNHFGVKE